MKVRELLRRLHDVKAGTVKGCPEKEANPFVTSRGGLIEDGVVVTDAELQAAYAEKNPKAKTGDFEKNRENFRRTTLSDKQREALDAYVKKLMSKAEIKINQPAAS